VTRHHVVRRFFSRETVRPAYQRARKLVTRVLPYRKLPGGSDALDAEYARGAWDYLWSVDELARFGVVIAYCHYLHASAHILELGCGEGILRARMDASKVGRFVGVDISHEAITRATATVPDEATTFVCADAATYLPDEAFDIIVFNECLEYFDDPAALVRRYETWLRPDGAFVVSMFDGRHTARSRRIWKGLDDVYGPADAARVRNRNDDSWTIKTYRPHGQAVV
jgi:2-polyprenyl-3-methyl-5-hydroxy-6-metoxy-1,4-benzoquinol methylase